MNVLIEGGSLSDEEIVTMNCALLERKKTNIRSHMPSNQKYSMCRNLNDKSFGRSEEAVRCSVETDAKKCR